MSKVNNGEVHRTYIGGATDRAQDISSETDGSKPVGESSREDLTLHLKLEDGLYGMRVDFPNDVETLLVDEPEPLGKGQGPSASGVLGAAVGSCLSASLLFCLRKAHIEVSDIDTSVTVSFERDERGRLRIGGIKVNLLPIVEGGSSSRLERCMELFEDFCVVTQSVRQGVNVEVGVDVQQ